MRSLIPIKPARQSRLAFDRSQRRYDIDNRLHVADCNLSKAMVCPYYGREIPDAAALGLDATKIYQLLRDPTELAKAAPTFANVPLLIEHVIHSADAPQQDATVGVVGSDVRFEAPYLKASLGVWTQEAIYLIESKQQEQLSCGYRYRADMTPGTYEGAPYDGVMRDLVANHVALVSQGRAGPDVFVADSLEPPMKHAALIARLKPFLATDAKEDALDAEIDKLKADETKAAKDKAAKDESYYGMTKEQWDKLTPGEQDAVVEEWANTDAKAKDKAAKDVKAAKDKAAKDALSDPPAKDAAITMDAMNVAIAAATTKAVTEAVARTNALHKARALVAPVVGTVAFDSAEETLAFGLKHLGVDTAGLHVSAYEPLFAKILEARAVKAPPRLATDSAAVLAFPSLSRIKIA